MVGWIKFSTFVLRFSAHKHVTQSESESSDCPVDQNKHTIASGGDDVLRLDNLRKHQLCWFLWLRITQPISKYKPPTLRLPPVGSARVWGDGEKWRPASPLTNTVIIQVKDSKQTWMFQGSSWVTRRLLYCPPLSPHIQLIRLKLLHIAPYSQLYFLHWEHWFFFFLSPARRANVWKNVSHLWSAELTVSQSSCSYHVTHDILSQTHTHM